MGLDIISGSEFISHVRTTMISIQPTTAPEISAHESPAKTTGRKSGWRTLPLELRQQILDTVLSESLVPPILDTDLSESLVPPILDTDLSESLVPPILDTVIFEWQVLQPWDDNCCWSAYPADEDFPLLYRFEKKDTPHAAHLKVAGAAVTARTVADSGLCVETELEVVLKALFKRVVLDEIDANERLEEAKERAEMDEDELWIDSDINLIRAQEELDELILNAANVRQAIEGLSCYEGGVCGGTAKDMATEDSKDIDVEGREGPTAATKS